VRPFCQGHGVEPGGCSRALRRALVDFGAEASFAKAAARTLEHHGVAVGAWRARAETYRHARRIGALKPAPRAESQRLVAQIDGSMIPTVKPAAGPGDRRKARAVEWREVRACLARDEGSVTPLFGGTLATAEVAGLLWREVAEGAGLTAGTRVHALGDGAPWIVPQVQKHFGPQASYLVDFYHVSEYLAAAAPPGPNRLAWLQKQQDHLLANKAGVVLRNLARRLEPPGAAERPVAQAHRYLSERRDQLNYAQARREGLPIGSGEIESAHRHLIQPRLKIPGAWKEQNAELMLNLRVARANGLWAKSWSPQLN
jgi:hypothetical protein